MKKCRINFSVKFLGNDLIYATCQFTRYCAKQARFIWYSLIHLTYFLLGFLSFSIYLFEKVRNNKNGHSYNRQRRSLLNLVFPKKRRQKYERKIRKQNKCVSSWNIMPQTGKVYHTLINVTNHAWITVLTLEDRSRTNNFQTIVLCKLVYLVVGSRKINSLKK